MTVQAVPVRAMWHMALVDGADQGHAAWMIYAPDGTLSQGPIASDSDAAAIFRSVNAPPTDAEIIVMRDKVRAGQDLHLDDRCLLATIQPLPENAALMPDGTSPAWGPIQNTHEIGDIQVVEYLRDCSRLSPVEARVEHGVTMFKACVEGYPVGGSCRSLDSALIAAVAFKRGGRNSRAAGYFDLMTLGTIA